MDEILKERNEFHGQLISLRDQFDLIQQENKSLAEEV